MSNRIKHSAAEHNRSTFYQLPKFLFTDEFKGLSYGAKVLYALLRDRHELSVQNDWIDDKGDIYLIMSRDEMCALMDITLKTIIKFINELKEFELMDEDRRGLGKANIIYLLQVKTCKNSTRRPVKNTGQDVNNFHANDTYRNQTEVKDISISGNKPKKKTKKLTEKDTPGHNGNGSFSTDDFYEAALKRSYENIEKKGSK